MGITEPWGRGGGGGQGLANYQGLCVKAEFEGGCPQLPDEAPEDPARGAVKPTLPPGARGVRLPVHTALRGAHARPSPPPRWMSLCAEHAAREGFRSRQGGEPVELTFQSPLRARYQSGVVGCSVSGVRGPQREGRAEAQIEGGQGLQTRGDLGHHAVRWPRVHGRRANPQLMFGGAGGK